MKKAQNGKKVVKKTTVTRKDVNPADSYKGMKDSFGNPVGGEGTTPPFKAKKIVKASVKPKAKMKSGGKMTTCKHGCK